MTTVVNKEITLTLESDNVPSHKRARKPTESRRFEGAVVGQLRRPSRWRLPRLDQRRPPRTGSRLVAPRSASALRTTRASD